MRSEYLWDWLVVWYKAGSTVRLPLYSFMSPLHAGVMNMKKLMNLPLPEDAFLQYYVYSNEIAYRQCDAVTRETGRLTKMLQISDPAGISFSNVDFRYAAGWLR